MNTAIAKIQTIALPERTNIKRIISLGLCVLAICGSLYVYFVGKIVFDVVARRTTEISIRKDQSRISSLESQYLAELRTLDLSLAESVGLKESRKILYASRSAQSSVGFAHEF